jgi:hypothetical protein
MPLAFASLMGGTCTLIGTSTNVAVSGAITKLGLEPFRMFEFTFVGVVLMITGILYMTFIGTRMVPERDSASVATGDAMREYLAEVVVLPNSPLIGQEAFDSDFSALEFQVLKIRRDDLPLDAGPNLRFEEGDVVLVAGKVENLIKVKKIEGHRHPGGRHAAQLRHRHARRASRRGRSFAAFRHGRALLAGEQLPPAHRPLRPRPHARRPLSSPSHGG